MLQRTEKRVGDAMSDTRTDLVLVQEELCRIIANANRWQTCSEAWMALLNARRIAESIICETESRDTGSASSERK